MATIDRFKDALKGGIVFSEGDKPKALTAQMKYDYLAAVHTMEQLTDLMNEFNSRKKRRESLREKISGNCRGLLKKITDSEGTLTIKQIDAVLKGLKECREELLKIESVSRESEKLFKLIEDGVSAGK